MSKPNCVITVKLGTETYKGSGDTLLEALQSLPRPVKIISRGLVTIEEGEKNVERMLMPMKMKRLWFKSAQYLLAKQFSLLLR